MILPMDVISSSSSSATVNTADAGQCVSFALKRVRRASVRKGMVIVGASDAPPRGKCVLYHVFRPN